MMYYVRYDNGTIDGPFSVEHIRSMVAAQTLTIGAGVVEARSQGLQALNALTEWATVSQLLTESDDSIQLRPTLIVDPTLATPESRPPIPREAGAVIGIIGLVLLVFGALRWNSIESQLLRAVGKTDGLGLLLLLAGGAGLVFGGYAFFSKPATLIVQPASTPAAPSIEARLRQLDDLRSKNLITDEQHEERKRSIIAAI